MERTNARTLTGTSLPEPVSLASVDVSFISLRLVLAPVASTFEPDGGDLVPLVKPQFEAGRADVPRGVVRDPGVHASVLRDVAEAALATGLEPIDAIASPVLGPEGNREFLLHVRVPRHEDRVARAEAPGPLSDGLGRRLAAIARPDAA